MQRFCSNGNVSGLIDSADGSLDAKYEYGAFGEPLRVGGTAIAADNPFRFSTKYTDSDGARKRGDGTRRSGVPGAKRRVRKTGALWATDEQNQLTSMTMKTGLPTGMTRKRLEPDYTLQGSAGLQRIPCRTTGDPRHGAGTGRAANSLCEAVVQFKYDYLGRRVQKVVKNNWTGSSGTTIANVKYVYDGHNLIAELDASGNTVTVLSTYVWGLDLSGTTWGAGGVGGLLMIKDGSQVYFPGYDGNGNVSGLVDSADGSLDAKYEYGAFGEPLRVSGTTIAADNPFRYSTKYTDEESGLVYYGFRYYSPSLGRFLNRDPIGELGGSNLYAFVENDPVNGWDYLGYGPDYIGEPGSCVSQCLSYMAEWEYRDFEACMEACEGPRSDRWRAEFSVKNKHWVGPDYYFFRDDYEDDEYLDDRECREPSGPTIDPTIGSDIDPTRAGREIDPAKGEPKVYDAPDLPEMIVLDIRETGQKLTIEDGVITYNSIYDFNDNGIYEPDELDHIRRLQRQDQHVRDLEQRIREIYRANPHQFGADVGEKRYKSDMIRIVVVAGGTAAPIVIGEGIIYVQTSSGAHLAKHIIAALLQFYSDYDPNTPVSPLDEPIPIIEEERPVPTEGK